MGAGGFGTLAGHFTDRTVVTYDPRGVERSTKADPASQSTPEQHADDLHRIIAELGAGPVDLFASSGGAVNALALVAKHPEQVRTLVAHEPPLASILPDREGAMAADAGDRTTPTSAAASAPAMAQFIVAVSHKGPMTPEFAAQPAPGPGDVRDAGRGRRHPDRPAAGPEHRRPARTTSPTSTRCGAASTRIVLAAGVGVRRRDGAPRRATPSPSGSAPTPVIFPSGHGGFLGGEYGQAGEPDAFAAKLREVLAEG